MMAIRKIDCFTVKKSEASKIMEGISQDTTLKSAKIHYRILQNIGFEGRAHRTFEICNTVRRISEEGIRKRHPDYNENQIRLAFIKLVLGHRLFEKVYPDVEVQV